MGTWILHRIPALWSRARPRHAIVIIRDSPFDVRAVMRVIPWCLVFIVSCNHVMAEQEDVLRSRDFVRGLSATCTYTDGYVCAELREDDFLTPDSERRLVPGAYLAAWEVARRDFSSLDDLTREQKDLKHYRIGFTENDRHYVILFRALLLPRLVDGKPQGVMQVTYGQTTKYWIDKTTLMISDRKFLK